MFAVARTGSNSPFRYKCLSDERSVVILKDQDRGDLRAEVGRDVSMGCEYRMTSEELYSIKWYRDDNEFYRYIPTGNIPARSFSSKLG